MHKLMLSGSLNTQRPNMFLVPFAKYSTPAWLCLCRVWIEMPCYPWRATTTRTPPHDLACYILLVLRSPHATRILRIRNNLISFYNWSGAYQSGSSSVETENTKAALWVSDADRVGRDRRAVQMSPAGGKKLDSPRQVSALHLAWITQSTTPCPQELNSLASSLLFFIV